MRSNLQPASLPVSGGLRTNLLQRRIECGDTSAGTRRRSRRSSCSRCSDPQFRKSRQLRLSRLPRAPGNCFEATLRKDELLTILGHPRLTISERLARVRGRFSSSINELLASRPDQAALARAMLLGDRSFVEHDRVVEFQQTGVYHVLVLAGLHVGALTVFFIWAGRRLRLGLMSRTLLTLVSARGLCWHRRGSPADFSRRFDGRDIPVRAFVIPPHGFAQRSRALGAGHPGRAPVGNQRCRAFCFRSRRWASSARLLFPGLRIRASLIFTASSIWRTSVATFRTCRA